MWSVTNERFVKTTTGSQYEKRRKRKSTQEYPPGYHSTMLAVNATILSSIPLCHIIIFLQTSVNNRLKTRLFFGSDVFLSLAFHFWVSIHSCLREKKKNITKAYIGGGGGIRAASQRANDGTMGSERCTLSLPIITKIESNHAFSLARSLARLLACSLSCFFYCCCASFLLAPR